MPPWATLPRTIDDNTTIDQAIDTAIQEHLADAMAHVGTDESLEVHRTADVIDHPAESTVNDKIKYYARRFSAIVDPSSEVDFDTIESAITFVNAQGGGTILLAPGTHYLSGAVELPLNIIIEGAATFGSIISCSVDDGKFFYPEDAGTITSERFGFRNIAFDNGIDGVFDGNYGSPSSTGLLWLDSCTFLTDELGLDVGYVNCLFEDVSYSNAGGKFCISKSVVTMNGCSIGETSGTTGTIAIEVPSGEECQLECIDCYFYCAGSAGSKFFNNVGGMDFRCNNSYFQGLNWSSCQFQVFIFAVNHVILSSSGYVNLDQTRSMFVNNTISSGSGNRVRLTSNASKSIVVANNVGTAITNSSASSQVSLNVTS